MHMRHFIRSSRQIKAIECKEIHFEQRMLSRRCDIRFSTIHSSNKAFVLFVVCITVAHTTHTQNIHQKAAK